MRQEDKIKMDDFLWLVFISAMITFLVTGLMSWMWFVNKDLNECAIGYMFRLACMGLIFAFIFRVMFLGMEIN